MPRLRRRRDDHPHALAAAATRITLERPKDARRQGGRRQPWQQECWDYFDTVPEVKQATWYLGNALAKVKLVVATMPDVGDEPMLVSSPMSGIPADIAARCDAELGRLKSTLGGQAEVMRELNMNLEVAGECYLIGWGARPPSVAPDGSLVEGTAEEWDVRSVDEVVVQGAADDTRYLVRDQPGDQGRPLDPAQDTIVRVWQRHPRWSALADCSLAGARGECLALRTLQAELLAASRSRHNAGLLTIPNELSFGAPTAQEDGDDPEVDPLTEEITEVFTEPVDDPSDDGAIAPSLLRGPAEFLQPKYVRWIDLGRKSVVELDQRIEARVERLARGLNMPVEAVMGHQKTTFANAKQVDEDMFEDHLEPRVLLIVDALTVGFLRPNLIEDGVDPAVADQVFIWYDASALVGGPDLAANAQEALTSGAISEEAYRRARGWSEEDAPSDEERLARAGLDRGTFDAPLALALLKLLGVKLDVQEPPAAPAAAPATAAALSPGVDDGGDDRSTRGVLARHPAFTAALLERQLIRQNVLVASGRETRRASDLGRKLVEIDRDLRTRLLVLADRTMARALERAGNRLRSHPALRSQLAHVRPELRGATIGRSLAADAGLTPAELLAEAFDPMREQFMAWGAQAQAQALDVAGRLASGFTAAQRTELGLRQAQSLEEAWTWAQSSLTTLAEARLFDPSAGADAVGEAIGDLSVPAGLIRQAMAIAGGTTGIETNAAGSAWVTLSEAGTSPVGGIATGADVMGAVGDLGGSVDGYEWAYGPAARRTFEPHRELDGAQFATWDDDVLSNLEGWPPFPYYMPGDHDGCVCDFVPVIIDAGGQTSADLGD